MQCGRLGVRTPPARDLAGTRLCRSCSCQVGGHLGGARRRPPPLWAGPTPLFRSGLVREAVLFLQAATPCM